MKHLSLRLLADTVLSRRKTLRLSQTALSERTGINRSILSRLEAGDYSPSVDQLLALSSALGFPASDVIVDDEAALPSVERQKIAVAGTGYVGLSLAVLLSQHNDVTAVDIVAAKVEKLRNWESPIQDEYIEKYLAEHEARGLSLTATTDGAPAYASADFIIVAAPTNYDPKTNFFDCSAVEGVLKLIREATADRELKPTVVIKSTIPVGYTAQVREKLGRAADRCGRVQPAPAAAQPVRAAHGCGPAGGGRAPHAAEPGWRAHSGKDPARHSEALRASGLRRPLQRHHPGDSERGTHGHRLHRRGRRLL